MSTAAKLLRLNNIASLTAAKMATADLRLALANIASRKVVR